MLRNHDLHNEFPNRSDQIHQLKVSNHHFRRLFDEYHEVNDEIHRIESGAEVVSDDTLTDLRKKRLFLKDELYAIMVETESEE